MNARHLSIAVLVAVIGLAAASRAQAQFDGQPNLAMTSSYNGNSADSPVLCYGSTVWTPAMAAVHQQIAQRIAIENDLRKAEVFWQKKRLHAQYRAEIRQQRLTSADVEAYREHLESSRALAKMRREQAAAGTLAGRRAELNDQQFDRVTGRLAWPALLATGAQLEDDRRYVASALTLHLQGKMPGTDGRRNEALERIESMRAALLKMARCGGINGNEYVDGKQFLKAVEQELERDSPAPALQVAAGSMP